jgi:hypothetical protein
MSEEVNTSSAPLESILNPPNPENSKAEVTTDLEKSTQNARSSISQPLNSGSSISQPLNPNPCISETQKPDPSPSGSQNLDQFSSESLNTDQSLSEPTPPYSPILNPLIIDQDIS